MTTKPKADDFDAAFAQASKDDDQQASDATASDDAATGDEDDADAAAAAASVEEGKDDAAAGGDDDADDDSGVDDDADDDDQSGGDDGDDDAASGAGAGDDGADDQKGGTPAAKKAGDTTTLTNEQLLERMSQLLGKGSAEEHQRQQKEDPPAKAAADDKGDKGDKGGEGKKEEKQQPLYTEEEQQLIDAYRSDWPDIARAEALSRRQEYQQLLQFVFTQVQAAIGPISETVDVMSNQAHLQQLQTKITDYDDVRDKVVAWVEEQPAYLRAAYEHVITEGTAEEVADLVDRYRRENGIEAPKAKASTDKQQQQSQDTELPAATKKAAAGLAPVRSKRSTPSRSADPADFDAAFAEFAKKI
jgi:hypothetical protein